MTKPKTWTSWRVCPECGSRATKLFSLNTGKYECQVCGHNYFHPKREATIKALHAMEHDT